MGKGKKEEIEPENEENSQGSDEEDDNEEVDIYQQIRAEYPDWLATRVDALKELDEKVDEIEKAYLAERAALELKYHANRSTIYADRKKVIVGETTPETTDADGANHKGIPGFWYQCLQNFHSTPQLIAEEDVPALRAITDITVDYAENMESYTLNFHFAENEFFTNSVISKTYIVDPNVFDDYQSLVDVVTPEIDWKEGKNLTVTEIKKKQKAKSGKNKGQVRTVTKTVPKHSFFNIFNKPAGLGEDGENEEEEEENEEQGGLKLSADEDLQVGNMFRMEIIPDAVNWFTGEAMVDYLADEEGDEDEEGQEGGDDEDDDEDDEDDEDDAPRPKAGGKKGKKGAAAPAAGANGQQPECKQN